VQPIQSVPLEQIRAAQQRLAGVVQPSPLVRLEMHKAPAEIYLKLENLQPIRSFKIRGLGNAILQASERSLSKGIWTSSMGNAALAVAWHAHRLGLPCTIVVPHSAVETKLAAIRRLGGRIIKTDYETWWQTFRSHQFEGLDSLFVHPFADTAVIAGNGIIGLEILDRVPDLDAVIVPYGGGGLSCGIAAALQALRPEAKVYASEVDTAAPLAASLAAGGPQRIERLPSFVDGIGAVAIAEQMWPLVRRSVANSIVVSLSEIASAIRLLIERHCTVAEGAGASSLAAALTGAAGSGKVVCVVSGGNIETSTLAGILLGTMPRP
jgi:threonine dehydratase